jgi:HD-GYP domain-containing protein (c-di-GMP phosphodiesterase class II)/sensor domain CHASE-containing protein
MNNLLQAELRPAMLSWKRYWPAGLAICCGLGFSLVVFFMLRGWESRDIETAFCNEAADRAAAVKNAFETPISLLKSVQAAFNGIPRIERDEFNKLLAPFHDHARSIVAVEWAPRVADSQRQEYENAARQEGIDGFQFTEQDSSGRIVRAAKRNEYFPVYYIGPGPGNPVVFGYDLASEPTRLEAVFKACDSGKIQASGRIAFIQDEKARDGFLILLPVYEQSQPLGSLEDRRRIFRGTVIGVFRPDVLIETALAQLQPEGVDVCLYDSSEPTDKEPFYFHASRSGDASANAEKPGARGDAKQMHYHSRLELAGHPWDIECISIPKFIAVRQTWWPWATLAAGMAFTAMFAAYIMLSLDRRAYAERLVHEKRIYAWGLETKVRERTEELRLAQEEIIQRLVTASLWRDEETGTHIHRTGLFSEALAKAAGWSAAEAEIIRQAAPMHDVGKIGIPDAVLRKPGMLTPKEFEVIKTHTLIGAEMLADATTPMLQMAREIALYHHEHWDGEGYPMGLSGQQIPESARIMAIVDVYDALTHDRVYRAALPEDESLAIMLEGSGTHFDPSLLALFFTILPEISCLSQEFPDDVSNELKLARAFAAVLARSNSTEDEVLLSASGSFSQSPYQ